MNFYLSCAREFAERPLATDDTGKTLFYRDVLVAIEEWKKELGVEKRLIALLMDNSIDCLRAYLSLAACGHAIILLPSVLSSENLARINELYLPDFCLSISNETGALSKSCQNSLNGRLADDLSVLLSTSGSTGSPKLVRFDAKRLECNARAIAEYLQLDRHEQPLCHLPFYYSFGLSILHSHYVVGAHMQLTKFSIMEKQFWERLDGATSLSGVPFHFELLKQLRFERRAPSSLKTLTQAGGKMREELVSHFASIAGERDWQLIIMYGQTEAAPRISWLPPENVCEKPNSIGVPIPGVSLALLDEQGQEILIPGQEGELVVKSPSIMLGYAEKRSDLLLGDEYGNELKTGDVAKFDKEGFFYIVGRKSRFVKVQGNRVSLQSVEDHMKDLGHDCVCLGRDDELLIVMNGECVDLAAVRDAAVRSFSIPPRSVIVRKVAKFPRAESGKVKYAELMMMMQGEASV
ncbi:Acyl-CoA synthetase (AMP-forming)/AMP-acid ligase II [Pseudovibrio denitrificans]|uniref:Acyl-CoA synthetase (AMP-forming)/AMP-acid ligase II n=1 Tax=Pseudovibrio denitrificans TaxID=258256 RepID=A0A1I7CTN2_9HYPH|nr:AMP-binding protein [Pseudovibrio denitrificans]SFU02786.1 Acyl-CoA synthetase (AMP-forming)/AMP-acid ligase II [Pseudovibrio denitrificans]